MKLFKRFLLSSRVSWGPLESSWSPLASFFFLLGYPGRFLGTLLGARGPLWAPCGGLWRRLGRLWELMWPSWAHLGSLWGPMRPPGATLVCLDLSLGSLGFALVPPDTSHKPTNCPPHTQEFKLDVRSPHASPKMTAGQGREGINLLFIFFPL